MLKSVSQDELSQAVFERFYQTNPNPVTEIIYHSPFELLVAAILSAQTTDKAVNQVTAKLFKVANTPLSLIEQGEDQLTAYIRSINYYPTKARHILKTCRLLLERHEGAVPSNRADLEALPGVGRKVANIVLSFIFGHAEIPVDTHIFRVSNRTGLAQGRTPRMVEKQLLSIVPVKHKKKAHHWLVLHGRYICRARKPLCNDCLIQDLCAKNF